MSSCDPTAVDRAWAWDILSLHDFLHQPRSWSSRKKSFNKRKSSSVKNEMQLCMKINNLVQGQDFEIAEDTLTLTNEENFCCCTLVEQIFSKKFPSLSLIYYKTLMKVFLQISSSFSFCNIFINFFSTHKIFFQVFLFFFVLSLIFSFKGFSYKARFPVKFFLNSSIFRQDFYQILYVFQIFFFISFAFELFM